MLRPRELFLGFFDLVSQVLCMLPIDKVLRLHDVSGKHHE